MPNTIEQDLVSVLSGVTLFPLSIPTDATFPCVSYQQISDFPYRSHTANTLRRIRYQINCYGKTYTSAISTAQTVKTALDLNKVNFTLAYKINEVHTKEVESGLYEVRLEFTIWTSK